MAREKNRRLFLAEAEGVIYVCKPFSDELILSRMPFAQEKEEAINPFIDALNSRHLDELLSSLENIVEVDSSFGSFLCAFLVKDIGELIPVSSLPSSCERIIALMGLKSTKGTIERTQASIETWRMFEKKQFDGCSNSSVYCYRLDMLFELLRDCKNHAILLSYLNGSLEESSFLNLYQEKTCFNPVLLHYLESTPRAGYYEGLITDFEYSRAVEYSSFEHDESLYKLFNALKTRHVSDGITDSEKEQLKWYVLKTYNMMFVCINPLLTNKYPVEFYSNGEISSKTEFSNSAFSYSSASRYFINELWRSLAESITQHERMGSISVCPVCGKLFEQPRTKRLTCSKSCKTIKSVSKN